MRLLILLLGVLCGSLSAVFVRWSTAPSLVLALYRMAFPWCWWPRLLGAAGRSWRPFQVGRGCCAWPAVGRWGCISPHFFRR